MSCRIAQRVRSVGFQHFHWPADVIGSAILAAGGRTAAALYCTRLGLIVRLVILFFVFSFRLHLLNVGVALAFVAAGGVVIRESGFLRCAVSALVKHARIVVQRLQIPDNDPTELRVRWIDEAVIFMRCEDGRDEEQTALAG